MLDRCLWILCILFPSFMKSNCIRRHQCVVLNPQLNCIGYLSLRYVHWGNKNKLYKKFEGSTLSYGPRKSESLIWLHWVLLKSHKVLVISYEWYVSNRNNRRGEINLHQSSNANFHNFRRNRSLNYLIWVRGLNSMVLHGLSLSLCKSRSGKIEHYCRRILNWNNKGLCYRDSACIDCSHLNSVVSDRCCVRG